MINHAGTLLLEKNIFHAIRHYDIQIKLSFFNQLHSKLIFIVNHSHTPKSDGKRPKWTTEVKTTTNDATRAIHITSMAVKVYGLVHICPDLK